MASNEFSALILGGGLSSRMKASKLLLPLGDETVIEKVFALFRMAGLGEILVVLGHDAERIWPLLKRARVRWTINEDYRSGMFSSVRKGVGALSGKCRGFFVLPADMPLVKTSTLRALIGAFENSGKGVYRPCYMGKQGHPPLIASSLIPAIREYRGEGGLRGLLSEYQDMTADVDCRDPGILMDLDTPEDYRKALEYIRNA